MQEAPSDTQPVKPVEVSSEYVRQLWQDLEPYRSARQTLYWLQGYVLSAEEYFQWLGVLATQLPPDLLRRVDLALLLPAVSQDKAVQEALLALQTSESHTEATTP